MDTEGCWRKTSIIPDKAPTTDDSNVVNDRMIQVHVTTSLDVSITSLTNQNNETSTL